MNQIFNIAAAPAAAALAWAVITFATAPPATAGEYCRKDITSAIVSCSFETMDQCQRCRPAAAAIVSAIPS
jgi:hypothetical protein